MTEKSALPIGFDTVWLEPKRLAEIRDGVLAIMRGSEGLAAIEIGGIGFGIERDGAAEVRDRKIPLGFAHVRIATVDIGGRKIGVETDGAVEIGNGSVRIAAREMDIATRLECLSIERIERDRLVKFCKRARSAIRALHAQAQIEMGGRQAGIQSDCLRRIGSGRCRVTQRPIRETAVSPRRRVGWIQLNCLGELGDGSALVPAPRIYRAAADEERRVQRVKQGRPIEFGDGAIIFAALAVDRRAIEISRDQCWIERGGLVVVCEGRVVIAFQKMHQTAIQVGFCFDAVLLGTIQGGGVVGDGMIEVAQLLVSISAVAQRDRALALVLALVLNDIGTGDQRDFRLAGCAADGIAAVSAAMLRPLRGGSRRADDRA